MRTPSDSCEWETTCIQSGGVPGRVGSNEAQLGVKGGKGALKCLKNEREVISYGKKCMTYISN